MKNYHQSKSPPVTKAEQALLICLIEECAEVTQAATKALRFGLHDTEPMGEYNNMQVLSQEIGDLLGTLDALKEYIKLDDNCFAKARKSKPERIKFYSRGIIT